MLTLPSYFSTNLTKAAIFLARISVKDVGTSKYLYVISRSLSGFTLKYGGTTITAHNEYLAAAIGGGRGDFETVSGIGEVDVAIPSLMFGGISAVNEISFLFLNQGDFAGSNAYDIENQEIELWEGRANLASATTIEITTDWLLRFRGRVRNVGDYDYIRWKLSAIDRRVVDTRSIPWKIINREDFPGAADDAVALPIPMIFGDFQTANDSPIRYTELAPMLCTDQWILTFWAADHQLDSFDKAVYRDGSGLIGFPEMITPTTTNDSSGFRITLSELVGGRQQRYKATQLRFIVPIDGFGSFSTGTVTVTGDQNNLFDGDPSTYAGISAASAAYEAFTIPQFALTGFLVSWSPGSYDFKIRVSCANRSGTINVRLGSRKTGTSGNVGSLNADDWTGTIKITDSPWSTWFDLYSWENLYTQEVIIDLGAGASVDIKAIWIEVIGNLPNATKPAVVQASKSRSFGSMRDNSSLIERRIRAWRKPDTKKPDTTWFISGKGAEMTSALVTSRSNGYSSGDLIDNPAYAIEWILRERLGLTSSEINTASFDAIGNTTDGLRKGWKINGVLSDQTDALEILSQICQEFALVLILSAQGQYRLVALDDRTQDYTVGAADIAGSASEGKRIAVETTGNDQILNDIYLDYRINYVDGSPMKAIYLSDVDGDGAIETNIGTDSGSPRSTSYSTWVGDSRDRYGTAKPFRQSLTWIRDAATAELSLKKFMDWNAFKRLVVKATLVQNSDTIKLEVGDVIRFNDDILTDVHQNVTRFLVTRINYPEVSVQESDYTFKIEAEEIPNANTGLPVISSRWISSADLGVA